MDSHPGLGIDQFIAEYGECVDTRTAALFVGAGLSMRAGYPSWEALVAPYRNALGIDLDDLPLVVQYFQDSQGGRAEQVRADVIAMVRDTDTAPTQAHRRLLSLPVPDIWTTNYDELVEQAAAELSIPATVYAEDADLATVTPSTKRLYKMHGTVGPAAASGELVLSRDQFERYPRTHLRFWQLLRAHFLTSSFLFLGFSLSDPNISEIFRLVRLDTPDLNRPHFALVVRPSDADRRIAELRLRDLARVGVKTVELADHAELDTVLGRLVARCKPPRAYLSGSVASDHPDPDRVQAIAIELGVQLSGHRDVPLMAGGELGAVVGYEVCRIRESTQAYRPDDLVVIRRVVPGALTPPNLRWGTIVFDGDAAEGLRSKAFEQVRAVVVLGGSDRTRAEIAQAKALGMGVIAVGASGGAAADQWEIDVTEDTYRLGERPVDREDLRRLNESDPATVAAACVNLLRQALFLA